MYSQTIFTFFICTLVCINAANVQLITPTGVSYKTGDTITLTWVTGTIAIPDTNDQVTILDGSGSVSNAATIATLTTIANPVTTTSYTFVLPSNLPSKIFFGLGSGASFAYTGLVTISGSTSPTTKTTMVGTTTTTTSTSTATTTSDPSSSSTVARSLAISTLLLPFVLFSLLM